MLQGTCSNPPCRTENQRLTQGRCRACYMYWWRNGTDRPEVLVTRGVHRDWTCRGCGAPVRGTMGLCEDCHRPGKAWEREKARRKARGEPIMPTLPRCVDCTKLVLGRRRCGACKEYRRHHRIPNSVKIDRAPPKINWCPVCLERPTQCPGSQRCQRCAHYYLRHGHERPRDLPEQISWKTLCTNCQSFNSYRSGRCNACDKYLRAHGVERPPELDIPFQCVNCKRSAPEVSHKARQLCGLCYWKLRNQVRGGKSCSIQVGKLTRPIESIRRPLQIGA
jgi:hypothetical protein